MHYNAVESQSAKGVTEWYRRKCDTIKREKEKSSRNTGAHVVGAREITFIAEAPLQGPGILKKHSQQMTRK